MLKLFVKEAKKPSAGLARFLAVSLLLAGCGPQRPASPTFTPTQPAESSPTATLISPATGTPTSAPTGAPAPTPTREHTPTPTSTPADTATALPAIVLRKGPDVIFTGDNTTMKVVWQLDAAMTSTLQWGRDTHYSQGSATSTEYDSDHQHAYTLTGLVPGAKYYYRVGVGAAYSAGSFYAAPEAAATDLKFFAYGDTRTNGDIHNLIAGRVISTYTADPAFQTINLAVGDLVSSGDVEAAWSREFFDPQYQNIRTMLANISFLSVMGNHEGGGALFTKYFPMPFVAGRYWSFDYGPAHMAMLDQYTPYEAGSPQYTWLANDLAASPKKWKFIVLHEPGWSAGGGHPNNTAVQNEVESLAERYGVAIVFGGHNHYYARAVVNGVQHLTVGGGGAPLYTPIPGAPNVVMTSPSYSFAQFIISGDILTGTAVKVDGTIIETFTVTK